MADTWKLMKDRLIPFQYLTELNDYVLNSFVPAGWWYSIA